MTGPFAVPPSPWIRRFAHLVGPGTRVLDLAAGEGRHSRFFAARGCSVLAVDRDARALASFAHIPNVTAVEADLEQRPWPLGAQRFDAVIVTHYLHRPLFAHIDRAIAPEGVLLYETFAAGNERFGKPSNPDFLLRPGELLNAFTSLRVVAFEQGEIVREAGRAVMQRLAAVGSARPWPTRLESEAEDRA